MLATKLMSAASSAYQKRQSISPTVVGGVGWVNFGRGGLAINDSGEYIFCGDNVATVSSYPQSGAGQIYLKSGATWGLQATLIGITTSYTYFAQSAAFSAAGDTLAIGIPEYPLSGYPVGAVRVYVRTGSTWSIQDLLRPSTISIAYQGFGQSVALSEDGNTLIGGIYRTGHAAIFTRAAGIWSLEQIIGPGVASSGFGGAVSISSDGNTALVSAPNEDDSPYTDNGALYIYTRSGGVWTLQQRVTVSDKATNDQIGLESASVSLSGDGNLALAGARRKAFGANSNAGAVYVFTRTGGVWTQTQKITAAVPSAGLNFGWSVRVNRIKSKAIIGAVGAGASYQGASYVYNVLPLGTLSLQQILVATTTSNAYFGYNVAINKPGNILAASIPFVSTGSFAIYA
jgi:hypothetical protein